MTDGALRSLIFQPKGEPDEGSTLPDRGQCDDRGSGDRLGSALALLAVKTEAGE